MPHGKSMSGWDVWFQRNWSNQAKGASAAPSKKIAPTRLQNVRYLSRSFISGAGCSRGRQAFSAPNIAPQLEHFAASLDTSFPQLGHHAMEEPNDQVERPHTLPL